MTMTNQTARPERQTLANQNASTSPLHAVVSWRPWYEANGITIYHGDCRDVLPALDVGDAALVSDPPYGISYSSSSRSVAATARDHDGIVGDDEPFDPAWLLGMPWRRRVLFGANHYARRLPDSACWVVWDKLDGLVSTRGIGFNDSADCELIWTDLNAPARLVRLRWIGMLKGSEATERRVHPTQKPVALMGRLLNWLCDPAWTVIDPYRGSGTTLRAAKDSGRRAIGIEIEERYCEIAARRLEQGVLF